MERGQATKEEGRRFGGPGWITIREPLIRFTPLLEGLRL